MVYSTKPWLKSYDPGIRAEIEIPEGTVADQLDIVLQKFGSRPALYFHGIKLTFNELISLGNRFAQFLLSKGCGLGHVVAVSLPNVPQYLIAQIGISKAGCAASGISPLLTPAELAYQLNDCKAKAIVTFDALLEHRIMPILEKVAHLELIVVTGLLDFLPKFKQIVGRLLKKVPHGKIRPVKGKDVVKFKDILSSYPDHPPKVKIRSEDHYLIQYTGGTTGLPKGTVLTHHNLVANLAQIQTWLDPDVGEEVVLSGFPFFHLAGLALGLNTMFMGGAQILIPDPRNTKHITKEIAVHRPTVLVNVPSLYMMLMEEPSFRKLDFSRLKTCISAAAPFPVDAIKELEKIVGENKLLEAYGMTETSPIITMNPRKGRKKIGSVGLPVPSTLVKLVDLETGSKEVPLGNEGEIIVSGPQVMKEYLNKPEETAIALREHEGRIWLHTGDVARMDEEGFFTIVDRTKDMLNVGGFKVFSRELEEKLYEHPIIEACAIVGVPNPKRPGTDIVKLVVQKKAEFSHSNPEELKFELLAFAKKHFAPYKIPKLIEFVDQLPLTPIGKVDKKALRKRL